MHQVENLAPLKVPVCNVFTRGMINHSNGVWGASARTTLFPQLHVPSQGRTYSYFLLLTLGINKEYKTGIKVRLEAVPLLCLDAIQSIYTIFSWVEPG